MNERTGASHGRNASESIRMLLSGKDRRSLAKSADAQEIIRRDPRRISEIVALAQDDDWLISMRALDLLEKLAHDDPDTIAPFNGSVNSSDRAVER